MAAFSIVVLALIHVCLPRLARERPCLSGQGLVPSPAMYAVTVMIASLERSCTGPASMDG